MTENAIISLSTYYLKHNTDDSSLLCVTYLAMHTFTNMGSDNTHNNSATDKSGINNSPYRSSSAAAADARRNRRHLLASSAHISRNQIQGLLDGDGDGSVPCSDTTAAGYRHHSHVIRVPIRDEEEENRVPISIDVSTMTEEEIEEIRTLILSSITLSLNL